MRSFDPGLNDQVHCCSPTWIEWKRADWPRRTVSMLDRSMPPIPLICALLSFATPMWHSWIPDEVVCAFSAVSWGIEHSVLTHCDRPCTMCPCDVYIFIIALQWYWAAYGWQGEIQIQKSLIVVSKPFTQCKGGWICWISMWHRNVSVINLCNMHNICVLFLKWQKEKKQSSL